MTKQHTSARKKASLEDQDLLYSGFTLQKSSLLRDLSLGSSPNKSRQPGILFRGSIVADDPAGAPSCTSTNDLAPDLPTEKQIFSLLKYFSSLYGSSGDTPAAPPEDFSDHPALRELWYALSKVSEQHLKETPEAPQKHRAKAILNMAEHFTTGLINDLRVADRRAQEEPEDAASDPDDLPEYEENRYSDDAFPRYVFSLFQETLRVLESVRTGTPKQDTLPLYAMAPLLW